MNMCPYAILFSVVAYSYKHVFTHLQYVAVWPDISTPTTIGPVGLLIGLVKAVRHLAREKANNVKILLHGGPGVGRTGTFIALYQLMEKLDSQFAEFSKLHSPSSINTKLLEEKTIDIFEAVFELRKKRCEMVNVYNKLERYITSDIKNQTISLLIINFNLYF